ncbi:MAG: type II toxin-antitoxin system HicB family antitoxin [Patescibacteria group bacterium]
MKAYTYRIIIEPDGKYYHGYVPALSGCHTFGRTIVETKKNLREAIEVYLESLIDDGANIPGDLSFESFETISLSRPQS